MGRLRLTDLQVRPASRSDADAVLALLIEADVAADGEPDIDMRDLLESWEQVDLLRNTWLAFDGDLLVGYAALQHGRPTAPELWLTVLPAARRRGIGSHLLRVAEARAQELVAQAPAGYRVALRSFVSGGDDESAAFASGRGYAPVRRYWRMRIDMEAEPPKPVWPEGVSVRRLVEGRDDPETWETMQEAFSDHWGSVPVPFEVWRRRHIGRPDEAWWLAVHDGRVVGGERLSPFMQMGWINTVGVRRDWRKRGVATALLLHAFGEFWRQGRRSVALGVDSENLTGATRLYERVGMHVDRAHDLYVKVLRQGRELAARS